MTDSYIIALVAYVYHNSTRNIAKQAPHLQMTTISWNCRDLVAATTSRELHDLVKGHKPAILFLMEARAQKERLECVRRKFKFQNVFCVLALGIVGGLCLLWNNNYDVQILHCCRNFIHTWVKEKKTKNLFEITFVYGNPLFSQRRHLWRNPASLKPRNDRLWWLMGDFNEMVSIANKDGITPIAPIRMNLFRDFLNSTDLIC